MSGWRDVGEVSIARNHRTGDVTLRVYGSKIGEPVTELEMSEVDAENLAKTILAAARGEEPFSEGP